MKMAKNIAETVLAYLAGALFSIGWWIWIDATIYHYHVGDPIVVIWWQYVAGVISTIGLLGVNVVSWNDLNSNFIFGDQVSSRAKIFLFCAFIVCFGGLIAAIWISIQYWFIPSNGYATKPSVYGGVALLVQNGLIFAATLMLRFSKPAEEEF